MKQFIKDLLSSDSPTSSKRVFGAIGFMAATGKIVVSGNPELIEVLLFTSAALLGLETVTKIFKK